MGSRHRSLVVIAVAALVAACGTEVAPTPTASPPPTAAPTTTAAPSPIPPGSPTPSPAASPTPTPVPVGAGGFRTPAPPPAGATWTGIRWRKIAADDPLAHVRAVTRWPGGFVAVGDIALTDGRAGTKVWTSSDGRTWNLLAPGVFGSSAIVVGVAPLGSSVVAFTMEATERGANGSPKEAEGWTRGGPWRSWTSTDGRTWIAHPGPDFRVPSTEDYDDVPTLLAGAGKDVVALVLGGHPLAFTHDGATWEPTSIAALPGGSLGWDPGVIAAVPPGFLAVGHNATVVSADGRTWTRVRDPACPAERVYDGPKGLIVTGEEGDPHTPVAVWCETRAAGTWREVAGYQPLGVSRSSDADCRGTCPNGILLADGERIVAYRNHAGQAGWTSRDGRTWTPLAFSGPRPTPWRDLWGSPYRSLVTPIGLLLVGGPKDVAWLGVPRT